MLRLRIVSGTVAVRCNEGETRVGAIVGELLRAIRGRFTRGATYCRGRGWWAGKVPQVSRSLRRKGKEITWKWREYALPSSPPSPLPPSLPPTHHASFPLVSPSPPPLCLIHRVLTARQLQGTAWHFCFYCSCFCAHTPTPILHCPL